MPEPPLPKKVINVVDLSFSSVPASEAEMGMARGLLELDFLLPFKRWKLVSGT